MSENDTLEDKIIFWSFVAAFHLGIPVYMITGDEGTGTAAAVLATGLWCVVMTVRDKIERRARYREWLARKEGEGA